MVESHFFFHLGCSLIPERGPCLPSWSSPHPVLGNGCSTVVIFSNEWSALNLSLLPLHPSPLSLGPFIQVPCTQLQQPNCCKWGQQSLCCQIGHKLCPILLRLPASFRIVCHSLQLEMSALGSCDTRFFNHLLPGYFFFFLFLGGMGAVSSLSIQPPKFGILQHLELAFHFLPPLSILSFHSYLQLPIEHLHLHVIQISDLSRSELSAAHLCCCWCMPLVGFFIPLMVSATNKPYFSVSKANLTLPVPLQPPATIISHLGFASTLVLSNLLKK